MDILKQNTSPQFEIVPRKKLDTAVVFKMVLISEATQAVQDINISVALLANENYTATLASFPIGKVREKFSYTILQAQEVVSLGRLMIISETESVQDFTTKTNNKFYS